MQQGIIQIAKENIIEALELHFGKISPEIIDKINQINDPVKLKELHKKAIQIKEFDIFVRALSLMLSQKVTKTSCRNQNVMPDLIRHPELVENTEFTAF